MLLGSETKKVCMYLQTNYKIFKNKRGETNFKTKSLKLTAVNKESKIINATFKKCSQDQRNQNYNDSLTDDV